VGEICVYYLLTPSFSVFGSWICCLIGLLILLVIAFGERINVYIDLRPEF